MAAASHSSTYPLAEAAYCYATAGMAVFPLVPRSKIPLISKAEGGEGWKDATTDLEQVRAWWTRWPTANIGYAPRGRHLIIDIDLRHQGKEAWAQLNQHIPMPETRRVKTGNGYISTLSCLRGSRSPRVTCRARRWRSNARRGISCCHHPFTPMARSISG